MADCDETLIILSTHCGQQSVKISGSESLSFVQKMKNSAKMSREILFRKNVTRDYYEYNYLTTKAKVDT